MPTAARVTRQARAPGVSQPRPPARPGMPSRGVLPEWVRAARQGDRAVREGVALQLQGTAGNQAVQRLLAPAAASGGTASVQRRVLVVSPPAVTPTAMTRAQRQAFVRGRFPRGRQRRVAALVLSDMAAASDPFTFATEDELQSELVKRVTMSDVMQSSQRASRGGLRAFGYPFTGPALYWGPRVNFTAKDSWQPLPPDDYDERRDPAKRAEIRRLPRGERHTVYGDPDDYSWRLTPTGRTDPWDAIMNLFVPQPPHRRSLLHCDYLVSLVHFRAFMASLGKPAFNARIAAFGPDQIELRWNMFDDLDLPAAGRPGLGSLQQVVPSSPRDLVIGDHVYFWNHPGYDAINENVGNAWRLENAVLIRRQEGEDIFLGHGSGQKTAGQMKTKLAAEYNRVANMALRLVERTRRGTAAQRASARQELADRFPNVHEVGGRWRVQGDGFAGPVDVELRRIRAREVLGLYDPWSPGNMYPVRRPAESA